MPCHSSADLIVSAQLEVAGAEHNLFACNPFSILPQQQQQQQQQQKTNKQTTIFKTKKSSARSVHRPSNKQLLIACCMWTACLKGPHGCQRSSRASLGSVPSTRFCNKSQIMSIFSNFDEAFQTVSCCTS
jgi:hypothetical protein